MAHKELQDLATAEMSSLICHFLPCSLQASNIELLRVLGMYQAPGWRPAFTHALPGTVLLDCVPDKFTHSPSLSSKATSSEKASLTPQEADCHFSGDLT